MKRAKRNELRKIWDNGTCTQCVHLHPELPEGPGRPTCDAFPTGIPLIVLAGDLEHFDPIKGDHGITFEPVPGAMPAPPPEPRPQCAMCKWMGTVIRGKTPMCRAFHGPIPDEIFVNRFDHRQPFPGDDGMRFEPDDDAEAADLAHLYVYLDTVAPHR